MSLQNLISRFRPAKQTVAAKIDELMGRYTQLGKFSGVVLVAQGERILLEKGYGLADVERGIPNGPDFRYRIGSVTKMFTAVAILQLQDRGLLSVADSLAKYLPRVPGADGFCSPPCSSSARAALTPST